VKTQKKRADDSSATQTTQVSTAVRSLACPRCGAPDWIAEIDVIPGYALILGIKEDGEIEWNGQTEVDWNEQRPASNPREFICLACDETLRDEDLGL